MGGPGPYDTACFHAQQAVEKLLKSVLALREQAVLRTHDLEELARLCGELVPSLQTSLSGLDLAGLSDYAVVLRYDSDFWPEREVAEEALEVAAAVRTAVLSTLPPDKES